MKKWKTYHSDVVNERFDSIIIRSNEKYKTDKELCLSTSWSQ